MKKLLSILIVLLAVGCQTFSKPFPEVYLQELSIIQLRTEVDLKENICAVETKIWAYYDIGDKQYSEKEYYNFIFYPCDAKNDTVHNLFKKERQLAEEYTKLLRDKYNNIFRVIDNATE